jgi:UDP-GlcNAc:undecaprenyl-phosphate/decaprenyl-phosphate GlcNAc-1-phosphate transferase
MQNSSLVQFLFPFGVALMAWPLARTVGLKFDIMDYPNHRTMHAEPTLRTGGLVIILAYISGLLVCGIGSCSLCRPFASAVTSLFALGLLEDKYHFEARPRLLLHAAIACIFVLVTSLVIEDIGLFAIPWFLRAPFTVFAIVGLINAFNFIDGMNGLASGLGIITAISLIILALIQGDKDVFVFAALLMGALSGFMILNLSGKLFMGDSGSYVTGFVIAVLSIRLAVWNPHVSPLAPLLFVIIPVFDTLFAIWRRKKLKREAFSADRRHLHHMLARRYQSKTKAVMVILILQSCISLYAILFHKNAYALMFGLMLFVLFLRRLWFRCIRVGNFQM